MGPREPQEKLDFRARRQRAQLSPFVIHACYLVNPCATDRQVFRKSVERMACELRLSSELGADYYVLHPGSHRGRSRSWGVRRAEQALCQAAELSGVVVPILLENTASDHGPGGRLEVLAELIGRLRHRHPEQPVGVCVDSCHAFAAGYDMREEAEVDRLVGEFDFAIAIGLAHVLHVNDTRDEAGSHRDRHEHIGKGKIGEKGLANFLNHPRLDALPVILETPWVSEEMDRENLERARLLARLGPPARAARLECDRFTSQTR